MSDYTIINGQLQRVDDELCHYGVLGMKWGVRKANYNTTTRNVKLRKKAAKYDLKAEKLKRKADKIHLEKDLEGVSTKALKADKYDVKAAKYAKKANKTDDEYERARLERKSAKYKYKASKLHIDTDQLMKSTGYGAEAMTQLIKSNVAKKKAEKARLKLAKNEFHYQKMSRKISSLSREEIDNGYSFVKDFIR